jgi:hypothetical protein
MLDIKYLRQAASHSTHASLAIFASHQRRHLIAQLLPPKCFSPLVQLLLQVIAVEMALLQDKNAWQHDASVFARLPWAAGLSSRRYMCCDSSHS